MTANIMMPDALDSVTRSSEVRQKYKIRLPFAQASVTFVKGSFTSDVGRSKGIRILSLSTQSHWSNTLHARCETDMIARLVP